MTPAAALLLTASGAMLVAAHRPAVGVVEPGDGEIPRFDLQRIAERAEAVVYTLTEEPAMTQPDIAARNLAAFLEVIRRAEGTQGQPDPYRVCYGYRHTIRDLSNHPAITGEWTGERLPDEMCKNAGFGPGCRSTAAGAYQIIRPTWATLARRLGLQDFGPASQDAAAIELIRQRGGLEDARAGRVLDAVHKCRAEWASLPGNYAGQGQRSPVQLQAWFNAAGGTFA